MANWPGQVVDDRRGVPSGFQELPADAQIDPIPEGFEELPADAVVQPTVLPETNTVSSCMR